MSGIVASPFDQVLILVSIFTAVEDLFDLVFSFIVDLNWFWRGWIVTVDAVACSQ